MKNEFKIRFDGGNELSSDVLIQSLLSTSAIIQELNSLSHSGKRISLQIKALEKGSFEVHIELIESVIGAVKTLFTKENVFIADALISGFVGVIAVRQHLKGKKSESITQKGSKVSIKNNNGNVLVINNFDPNILNNETIEKNLSSTFEKLDKAKGVKAFEITDSRKKSLVKVQKEEFSVMKKAQKVDVKEKKKVANTVNLHIVKLSFDINHKWDFILKGDKICAKIADEVFLKRIDSGEKFAKGDVLEVELETQQVFDYSVNTYVNESYVVKEILNHISREDPPEFDFLEYKPDSDLKLNSPYILDELKTEKPEEKLKLGKSKKKGKKK
jgi:hypothetical protein